MRIVHWAVRYKVSIGSNMLCINMVFFWIHIWCVPTWFSEYPHKLIYRYTHGSLEETDPDMVSLRNWSRHGFLQGTDAHKWFSIKKLIHRNGVLLLSTMCILMKKSLCLLLYLENVGKLSKYACSAQSTVFSFTLLFFVGYKELLPPTVT